jgi:TetR/AcrR family transcriptional regulator
MPTKKAAQAPRKKAPEESSRVRVLESATVEFAAHGFAGARIDRIAQRARLNMGMLYYHFRSKRGLYRAVLESIYEEAAKILEITARAGDPTRAALAMYVDLLVDNPHFADVLARELLDGGKQLAALFKSRPRLFLRVHAHSQQLLEQAMRDGELRKMDPELMVFTLTSTLCFLTAIRPSYGVFSSGKPADAAKWKENLVQLLFDGLRTR